MSKHGTKKWVLGLMLVVSGACLMQLAACLPAYSMVLLQSINRGAIFNLASSGIFQPCSFFYCAPPQ